MRLFKLKDTRRDDRFSTLTDNQLNHLHKILLDILVDMNKICVEHGLTFILIGGNAIGAIRHKGFIPWDDDVDVAMTRTDYEKFKRIIRSAWSAKYQLADPKDKINWGRVIPTLRLKHTVYKTIFDYSLEDPGISVDIFIIENTFNNPLLRIIHGVGCYFLGFLYSCRNHYEDRENIRKLSDAIPFKLKLAFTNTVAFFISFLSVQTVARWTDTWYALCKNDHSKYVSIPSDGPHFFGGLTLRDNLCQTVEFEFEGYMMKLPSDYDAYLRKIYGDYMQIPPEDKRDQHMYIKLDFGQY